jgi:hypothetical protein
MVRTKDGESNFIQIPIANEAFVRKVTEALSYLGYSFSYSTYLSMAASTSCLV